jgi:hypothetical protein
MNAHGTPLRRADDDTDSVWFDRRCGRGRRKDEAMLPVLDTVARPLRYGQQGERRASAASAYKED